MRVTRLRRWAPDLGLACVSLIAAASLTRLLQGGLGGPATGPVLVAAAVGSTVPALLAARRAPVALRMLVGTLAVGLVSLWTSAPGSTTFGLPTARTWHELARQLRLAHPILVAFALPLRSTPGIVFLSALLAGLVSVLASVILRSSDRTMPLYPGLALLCPVAILALISSQSASASLALPLASMATVVAITLAVAQPAPVRMPEGAVRTAWLSPTIVLSVAVVIAVTLTALSFGGSGSATGSAPGAGSGPPVPPTELSLTSHLVALEVDDANVVLFHAHSTYPTYWQVAVLNVLRNGVWVASTPAGSSTRSAAPAAPAATFRATVEVAHLSTRLLPVPPGTEAVTGVPTESPTGEGVKVVHRTKSGQRYATVSALPDNDPALLAGGGSVSTYPQALVRAEVALPALPASVKELARRVTAAALTPLGQAEALVNWFRSGRFRYTFDPPAPAPGADPLVSFLTQTRAGTCEQFAGAFTVLARTLGLPTRLVVGFTAGRRTGPDEVVVNGGDAHAWPQVYLGSAGWVSFEPTPQELTGEVAPEGVVGPTALGSVLPPTGPTTSVPTTTPPAPPTTVPPTSIPAIVPKGGSHASSGVAPAASALWWILLSFGAAALAVLVVLLQVRRRRRESGGRTPPEVSLRAAHAIDRALRRAGSPRPRWQPLPTFVDELSERLESTLTRRQVVEVDVIDQLRALLADVAIVAMVAERALYDPDGVDAPSARRAQQGLSRFRRALRNREISRFWSLGIGAGMPTPAPRVPARARRRA
jgi:transglutaminase-like putative cysteine protease